MKAIKKNMVDQILTSDNKILHCSICGAEYSGNAGDYWNVPDNHVFTCCDTAMQLVTKKTVISYI